MKGSFSKNGLEEFIKKLVSGKGSFVPYKELP